ncbi:class I SAM-dependent RNA methyltransferase [Microlunatus capsulatus]|uniref:tRNA/tmRNA/rRNA uracil-C5-methylase (TrmA/RlmC/RlmD family) n=1 Tax=Microlunatus capsulatus TaxID=99117 RepID=A0ABS4ZD24_9ACTN|nr:TRAM domain-containing protein [Microlunatus capsulatus]MBP2418974.1 tRNA/tmRNA/rRNA uracil-C5-methylase (TrmA/RlmC/RlmD family) [Microlunatus capsulatus]
MSAPTPDLLGPVEVGPVAHGGHCVARLPLPGEPEGSGGGRVVFVRHALPGERVLLRVTDDSHAKFWRADAVEVLRASPDRVEPPCPVARPGLCGGCDFQHVDLAAQRRLKTAVVAEQLQRLAGIDWDGEVVGVDTPATADGLHWRTRMRYQVDDDGRAGLRAHRSHAVVPLPDGGCPIASTATPAVEGTTWPAGAELVAVAAADGPALLVDGRLREGRPAVVEQAADRRWEVAADGFWQVHPAAADTLVEAVLEGLAPRAGERAFDLYCGVGLFAGALAAAGCRVWGLEAGHQAVLAARRNLEEFGDRVRLRADRVERGLAKLPPRADLVVLDPPRSGAGKQVVAALLERRPRAVAYVACDPAALARDLATAARHGYEATSIRGFDLFPMTQHVECVAVLRPAG